MGVVRAATFRGVRVSDSRLGESETAPATWRSGRDGRGLGRLDAFTESSAGMLPACEVSSDEATERASEVPPIDPTAVSGPIATTGRGGASAWAPRATRRAGIRFWVVLILLLVASALLAVTFWRQVQELFGL